jgi:hypothetical protein
LVAVTLTSCNIISSCMLLVEYMTIRACCYCCCLLADGQVLTFLTPYMLITFVLLYTHKRPIWMDCCHAAVCVRA